VNTSKQIAKHFREIYFGGNWTAINIKDQLQDVTWQLANKKKYSFNTIIALTYHINYYVNGVLKVFQGEDLTIRDKYSFNHPKISSQKDWDFFLEKTYSDAEQFAYQIEQISDNKLCEDFIEKEYGTYYRTLHGIIEHCHYHLGQIVILKKLLLELEKQ
jgi:hypothetical protein